MDSVSEQFGKRGLAFFGNRLACCLGKFGEVRQDGGMKIYCLQLLDCVRMNELAGMFHWNVLEWLVERGNADLLLGNCG